MKKILLVFLFIPFVMAGITCSDRVGNQPAPQAKKEQLTETERPDTERPEEKGDEKNSLAALIEKGNKAFTAQRYDESIELYTRALAINPDLADLHYSLGLAHGHRAQLDDAITEFKKAIAINPNHIKAYNNLGLAYERKVMLDQALSVYKQAITINPDYAKAHYNIGRVYLVKGMRDPALRSLSADHYYRAGVLFHEQGNKDWALMAYDSLKKAKSEELEQALSEKLKPELQQREDKASK